VAVQHGDTTPLELRGFVRIL